MLRPQGLFQNAWQQPWATPPVNGGMQAPPPAPPAPAGGPYQPATPAGGYPPGQYGQGQYQPGQYAPGPGQYAPGQYGPQGGQQAQYPPGQYGPGQYGADQYQTGQFGPGVGAGFGPDGQHVPPGQYGPDGAPIAAKRPLTFGRITLPRGPLVPAIVVAALVAIAATAVVLSSSSGPGSGPGSATPTTKSVAPTPGANSATELRAATQLSGLLALSGRDRDSVINAVTNVQGCGKNLAHDAQIFRTDAQNRRTLLAQLQAMPDRSTLSSGMLGDLTTGWQASASADDDLAKWAKSAASHCKNGNKNDPSLQASLPYDYAATKGKVAFTKLWNPLARKEGLPTYLNTQI